MQRNKLLLILTLQLFALPAFAQDNTFSVTGVHKCPMGRDYWLARPTNIDETQKLWVFVLVHSYGSTGQSAIQFHKDFKDLPNVIFLAPTFPSKGYQILREGAAAQLTGIFNSLKKQYKLQPKMFLFGFSGGAQFAHRFTMTYPQKVIGCSAHSGGTWSLANKKAMHIPLFFSCGLNDISKSTGSNYSRIDAAQNYFTQLVRGGYFIKHRYWLGTPHQINKEVYPITKETFLLATTGAYPRERQKYEAEIASIRTLISSGNKKEAEQKIKKLTKIKYAKIGRKKEIVERTPLNNRASLTDNVGIGGRSSNGKEYWIQDKSENEYGWQMKRAGYTKQRYQNISLLKEVAVKLKSELKNAPPEKKVAKETKETTKEVTKEEESTAKEKTPPRVVGYLPFYRIKSLSDSWTKHLTDLVIFSAQPMPDGSLSVINILRANALSVIKQARQSNIRVILCIGGWGRSAGFAQMTADPKKRAKFIATLTGYCRKNKLDGADFDWEFPKGDKQREAYNKLLIETKAAFKKYNMTVSVAIGRHQSFPKEVYAAIDFVNIMSYDADSRHATFEDCVATAKRNLGYGLPPEKLILGLPLYGRNTKNKKPTAYADIIKKHIPKPSVNEVDNIYFNGVDMIIKKTKYAITSNFGGVMIWEIGQDTTDETSLLKAITRAIKE